MHICAAKDQDNTKTHDISIRHAYVHRHLNICDLREKKKKGYIGLGLESDRGAVLYDKGYHQHKS